MNDPGRRFCRLLSSEATGCSVGVPKDEQPISVSGAPRVKRRWVPEMRRPGMFHPGRLWQTSGLRWTEWAVCPGRAERRPG